MNAFWTTPIRKTLELLAAARACNIATHALSEAREERRNPPELIYADRNAEARLWAAVRAVGRGR